VTGSALGGGWRRSLVAIPSAYIVGAVALGRAAPAVDRAVGAGGDRDADLNTARDILTSTATGMIAFTGLVIASVLVVVQFAASQYSPRLVLWFRGDVLVKNAIGVFLAAWLYALVALRQLEHTVLGYAPDVTVGVGLVLLVGAAVFFLLLLQRVMDRLRPRTLYAAVARDGVHAARAVYPTALAEGTGTDPGDWRAPRPHVVALARPTGVITAFDRHRLVAAATAGGVVVELTRALGEFVGRGQELLRVHGDGPVNERALLAAVRVADERTIEQDPAFALRIIVDTAIRALSPAVNDPTTAVHALDSIEVLVRELAGRDLEASLARGPDGAVRLAWRTPGWDDLLDLAFDEIRAYGASSVQVCRRLRAVLEDLHAATATVRHAAIAEHLARLEEAIRGAHPVGSPERALAQRADRLGLGLERQPLRRRA
jgi:uncharacterized membrane protein